VIHAFGYLHSPPPTYYSTRHGFLHLLNQFLQRYLSPHVEELPQRIGSRTCLAMSPSWILRPHDISDKADATIRSSEKRTPPSRRSKRFWILLCAGIVLLVIAIGLGVGLGIGLSEGSGGGSPGTSPPLSPNDNTNATAGAYWRPSAGTSHVLADRSSKSTYRHITQRSVYDIDLFDNNASTMSTLHA
jgi:hypothetical protein